MHERTIRVTVDSGTIEGFTRDGVHRWRSVPYARPPVGPLRYRAPQPVAMWRGVRYCHGFTYCAPQQRKYTLLGVNRYQPMSEDCLTLNVVTPESPSDGPLPVMFFIHGGGYIMGSSATPIYDSGLMDNNSATKSISVNVTGKSTLRLVVNDGGDGESNSAEMQRRSKLFERPSAGRTSDSTPGLTKSISTGHGMSWPKCWA